ncbi:hypothetical protein C8Q78DRAFT_1076942 [Trametes maxima]|nr:hypothetical protein C8Q78DRAFT_1076942 [Trametes maxima]
MYGFKRIHAHEIAQNIWDVAAASEPLVSELDVEKAYLNVALTVLIAFMTYYAITLSFELYRTIAALPIFNIRMYKTAYSWLSHTLTLPRTPPRTPTPSFVEDEVLVAGPASPAPSEDPQTSEYGASGDSDHDAVTDAIPSPDMSPQLAGSTTTNALEQVNSSEERLEQDRLPVVEASQEVLWINAGDAQDIDESAPLADALSPSVAFPPAAVTTVDVDVLESPGTDGLHEGGVRDTEILSNEDLETLPDDSHSPLLLPVHPSVAELDTPGDFLQPSAVSDICLSTLVPCEDLSASDDLAQPEEISALEEQVPQTPRDDIANPEEPAEVIGNSDVSLVEPSPNDDAVTTPLTPAPATPNESLFDFDSEILVAVETDLEEPVQDACQGDSLFAYVQPVTSHTDVAAEQPSSPIAALPQSEEFPIVGQCLPADDTCLETPEGTECDFPAATGEYVVHPEEMDSAEPMVVSARGATHSPEKHPGDQTILPDMHCGDDPGAVEVSDTSFILESALLVQASVVTDPDVVGEEAELEEDQNQLAAEAEWTPVNLEECDRPPSPVVITERTDEGDVKTQETETTELKVAKGIDNSLILLTHSVVDDALDPTLSDHVPAVTVQDLPAETPSSPSPAPDGLEANPSSKVDVVPEPTSPIVSEAIPPITMETTPAESATLSMQSLMDAALAASPSVKTRLNIGTLPNKPPQARKHTLEKPDWAVAPDRDAPKSSSEVPKHSPMPWRLRRKRRKARASGDGEQTKAGGNGEKAAEGTKAGGSESRNNGRRYSRGEGQKGPRNTASVERQAQGASTQARGPVGGSEGRRPAVPIQV